MVQSGNETEKFIAFLMYAENEFDDEDNGQFLSPFPEGVSVEECHLNGSSQLVNELPLSFLTQKNILGLRYCTM